MYVLFECSAIIKHKRYISLKGAKPTHVRISNVTSNVTGNSSTDEFMGYHDSQHHLLVGKYMYMKCTTKRVALKSYPHKDMNYKYNLLSICLYVIEFPQ